MTHEAILHYIWQYKLFSLDDLRTSEGDDMTVLHCGIHNLDSGPDFHQAKIKISQTIWAGNVELHIKSSDWLKHQHQNDKAYDNVILHVVWENDAAVMRTDGTVIPVLELKGRVDEKIIINYENLKLNNYWIPCEKQLKEIDDFTKQQCLDRMMMERLEEKSELFQQLYTELKGDWNEIFYITLAKSFGFKVNTAAFELLAKSLPQRILAKHKNSALQISALVFGTAGLLNRNYKDEYPRALKNEHQFLKAKYQLNDLQAELWRFAKTRPDNFPTVRLAQFAALILKSQHLFSKIIAIREPKGFYELFKNLPVHPYWGAHFLFDKEVSKSSLEIGRSSIDILLLNSIAPLLFFYGRQLNNEFHVKFAVELLEFVKPERNRIVKGFEERGLKVYDALGSQGIIHLKKYYCDQKKCLNCGIGLKILRS